MRYTVVLGVLLIALPLLLRISSPEPFPDEKSYDQLYRSSESNLGKNNIADLLFKLPPQLVLVALAAITLVALSFTMQSEIFLLLLVTAPVFVTTFTTAGPLPVAVALISVGALLVYRGQPWGVLAVPLCFMLGLSSGVLATIAIVALAIVERKTFVALGASFFALVSTFVVSFFVTNMNLGLTTISLNSIIQLFELRADVTIFLILLGVLGFVIALDHKQRLEAIVSVVIVACSLLLQDGGIIMAAFLALYGSIAVRHFLGRKWSFVELRTLVLLLVACALVFSSLVTLNERITEDTQRIDAARFISAAYPAGTQIAAPSGIAPILRWRGYEAASVALPAEPTALELILAPYAVVVVEQPRDTLRHYPLVYGGSGRFTIYEVTK